MINKRLKKTAALIVALGLVCGGAQAQTSDSTSLTGGSPPLPTGIWDANAAANTLSTSLINEQNQASSYTSTAAAIASAVANNAGGAAIGITYTDGAGFHSGLCSSTQSGSGVGNSNCPGSMPYFYAVYSGPSSVMTGTGTYGR